MYWYNMCLGLAKSITLLNLPLILSGNSVKYTYFSQNTDFAHKNSPFRPAFVNTLFPVTRPHYIYSTTLVIIIVIN